MKRKRRFLERELLVRRISNEVYPMVRAFVLLHGDRILRGVTADAKAGAVDLYRSLRKRGVARTALRALFFPSYGLPWLSSLIHVTYDRVRPGLVRDRVLESVSRIYAARLGTIWGFFHTAEEEARPVTAVEVQKRIAEKVFFPEDAALLADALRCGIATRAIQSPTPKAISEYLS